MTRMTLPFALLMILLEATNVDSFVHPRPIKGSAFTRVKQTPLAAKNGNDDSSSAASFAPSTVVDEDGPTPENPYAEPEVVDIEDMPEMHYDPNAHQVPHQPWRRGMTNGCEEPIQAEWRQEAEAIIYKAVNLVGGKVMDVTWFLAQAVITIDDELLSEVDDYSLGPEIQVQMPDDGVEYFDPEDPKPEVIWADEEEFLYERDEEEEKREKDRKYAPKELDDIDDEEDEFESDNDDVPLMQTQETREDMAAMSREEETRIENQQRPIVQDAIMIDTAALSTIARAILEALEDEDERLDILGRHEIVLASPGDPNSILEFQKEFDSHRGYGVAVETQDPWGSNRVLKGKLEDRNSMDIIINKKGRMVTIPHNFVKCVRVLKGQGDDEYEDEDEEE